MKVFVQVSMVFFLALVGLGSALQCFSCEDYTGRCSSTANCPAQSDGCLTLKERNGKVFRQCIKYSDCKSDILGTQFPKVSSFDYQCCSSNLCNSAAVSRTSVMAVLLSLALFWWCAS